jgi:hypothetical protein
MRELNTELESDRVRSRTAQRLRFRAATCKAVVPETYGSFSLFDLRGIRHGTFLGHPASIKSLTTAKEENDDDDEA